MSRQHHLILLNWAENTILQRLSSYFLCFIFASAFFFVSLFVFIFLNFFVDLVHFFYCTDLKISRLKGEKLTRCYEMEDKNIFEHISTTFKTFRAFQVWKSFYENFDFLSFSKVKQIGELNFREKKEALNLKLFEKSSCKLQNFSHYLL